MSASSLVAEAVWKEIESTHSVNDDQLWTSVFWSPCKMKPVCISCLARTLREPLELSTKEVSARYLLTPVEGLSFRLQGNPEEKTSICVLLKIFALVIRSSMMLSTEENNFCKHQLAARLAASLGSYVEVKVSDEELAVLLSKV
ncbi:hypothetical protein GmHk_06G018002 [Glycine max]|nr:hypothetical protein GmHk_06G018002 [Glycine max]